MAVKEVVSMKNFYKFVIFCFVGGTSVLIDLIFFNIFYWLGLKFIFCRLFAIIFSIIYNFSMNRNITFSARDQSVKKQLPRYIIVYAIAITVNLTVSVIMVSILGEGTLKANIASFIGIITAIPISFLGSLLWTFKEQQRQRRLG